MVFAEEERDFSKDNSTFNVQTDRNKNAGNQDQDEDSQEMMSDGDLAEPKDIDAKRHPEEQTVDPLEYLNMKKREKTGNRNSQSSKNQ